MPDKVTIRMSAQAPKVHSVVYRGLTPNGVPTSFYVPREVLGRLFDRERVNNFGEESWPDLDVTFQEAN